MQTNTAVDADAGPPVQVSSVQVSREAPSTRRRGSGRSSRSLFRRILRPRCGRGPGCGSCYSFTLVVLIIIPAIVMGITACIALPLWAIECSEGQGCEWYEWWMYLLGNLLGLATPLTDYSPQSGHWLAEMTDLIASVWSLSLTGAAIGVVASLTFIENLSTGMDRRLGSVFTSAITDMADAGGMSLDDFLQVVEERGLPLSRATATGLFRKADADGTGKLDHEEAQTLLVSLDHVLASPEEQQRAEAHANQLAEARGAIDSLARDLTALIARLEAKGVI